MLFQEKKYLGTGFGNIISLEVTQQFLQKQPQQANSNLFFINITLPIGRPIMKSICKLNTNRVKQKQGRPAKIVANKKA